MSLSGNVAVVTGGGRGIGRAIVEAFAKGGAKGIVVTARSADEVQEVSTEAERLGVKSLGVVCDLGDPAAVENLVAQTLEAFGNPDILINNAGYADFKSFVDITPEDWAQTFAVNVTGPYLLTRAFVPGMIARGSGRIINISSVAGLKGIAGQSAYCASKHALNGLTKVLALELNPHGIGVHAICPGGVKTRLADEAMPDRDKADWMSPEDIANAAVYLCSLSPQTAVDFLTLRRTGSVPL